MSLQLGLDDLLAELQHARRQGELGRLALLAYCDVRCWARQAGEFELADRSTAMFTDERLASGEAFIARVDQLISDLQQTRPRLLESPQTDHAFEPLKGREHPEPARF